MRHNTQVLPSNASPLRDGIDNGHNASRILQEQSVNRQANDFSATFACEPFKIGSQASIENGWSALQRPQLEAQQRAAYEPYSYGRRQVSSSVADERKIDHLAQVLWKRFESSEPYKRYRSRQQKDEKAGQEQKWPDLLEQAFFRAMVKYPPMGRRKLLHKGKQRGRNELVADHIQERTGHERSRKQVSSHIQVLKPFVEHDPYIMKWLSAPKETGDVPLSTCNSKRNDNSNYMNGRRLSMYTDVAPSSCTARIDAERYQLSLIELETVKKLRHDLDFFRPETFSMFIQRKYLLPNGYQQEDRLHTYTQSIEHPRGADIQFQDWQMFEQDYPQLARMNTQQPLDCNVIVADVSIAFPTDNFNDQNNVELGISFICSSKCMPSTAHIRCRNTFYKDGKLVVEHSGHYGQFDVQFQTADDGYGVTTSMRFGSSFWARTLAELASKRLKASSEDSEGLRDDVTNIIRTISVVVEVFFVSRHGSDRILVMQWMFRESSAMTGQASWSRIILPPRSQCSETKTHSVDSMHSYTSATATECTDIRGSQIQIQPALASTFEHSDSTSGSALTSTNWATSISYGKDHAQSVGENIFESDCKYNVGDINMSYEGDLNDGGLDSGVPSANAFNTTGLDSSAFNFDNITIEFAQDPSLGHYTQQWCDNIYRDTFESQPLSAVSAEASYELPLAHAGNKCWSQTTCYDYNI